MFQDRKVLLALWSPYQSVKSNVMDKPSKFVFKHIQQASLQSNKNGGRNFFERAQLVELLSNFKSKYVELEVGAASFSSSSDKVFRVSFYEKIDKDPVEYQEELEEYQLFEKQKQTRAVLNAKRETLTSINHYTKLNTELTVARSRLEEFTNNPRIPADKKKELVELWAGKVAELECKVNPVDIKLISALKGQIAELEKSLTLQNEILNMRSKNYEKPDCPSYMCSCTHCRDEALSRDRIDDDLDEGDVGYNTY